MQPTITKMNKPLEPGQWCKPKDEKEWKAVLDLADALGVYTPGFRSPYESCECIWANIYGSINECAVTPSRLGETDPPLSVPDFISGMYALAEKKEKDRATELPRGPRGQKPDMTQDRLHALEVKSVLFDDILKRLSSIEEDPLRNGATKLSTGGYAVEKRLMDIIRSAADTDHIYKRLSQLESWRDNVIKANQQ